MSAPGTPDPRAAWIQGMRELLDILEANPDLPLPDLAPRHPATFYVSLSGNPRAVMAALEAAIPAGWTGALKDSSPGDEYYYELRGTLAGLKIHIQAPASQVAEKRVTGQQVTDITEWVRLPAEPGSGEEEPEVTA